MSSAMEGLDDTETTETTAMDVVETKETKEKLNPVDCAMTSMDDVGGLDDDVFGEDEMIVLKPKDHAEAKAKGQEIKISKKNVFISTLVRTTIDQDREATEIDLPGVSTATLEEVVAYLEHHKGTEPPVIPKPLRSKEMSQVVTDLWDATFIDRIGNVKQDLYDLILAANYMDIKSLLHLGCAKIASLIKGKPLDAIQGILSTNQSATPDAVTKSVAEHSSDTSDASKE